MDKQEFLLIVRAGRSANILIYAKCLVSTKCLPTEKRLQSNKWLLTTKSLVFTKHLIDENLSNMTEMSSSNCFRPMKINHS